MLKAKFDHSYKKRVEKTGEIIDVFVYTVSGSDEELEAYAENQGEKHRKNENEESLWFSTRFVPSGTELIITAKKKVVANMSDFDQANSLAKQFGGNFGQEIARAAAQRLMGYGSAPTSAPSQAPVPQGNGSSLEEK